MNCLEFQNAWNDRFDSALAFDAGTEAEAALHERACHHCRQLGAGFRALGQWLPLAPGRETPSVDFADRVLRELSREPIPSLRFPLRRLRFAAAAALFVSVTAGFYVRFGRSRSFQSAPMQTASTVPSQRFADALSEASKATWTLARDASAPAARVGNDVLGVSEPSTGLSLSIPIDMADKVESSSELLRNVGQRVNEGVRPLSGTARTAFGFLLGRSPEVRPKPSRSASGA